MRAGNSHQPYYAPLLTHNFSTRGDNYPDTGGLHVKVLLILYRDVVTKVVGIVFSYKVGRSHFVPWSCTKAYSYVSNGAEVGTTQLKFIL